MPYLELNLTPDTFTETGDIRTKVYRYRNLNDRFVVDDFKQIREQIINLTHVENETGWSHHAQASFEDGFVTAKTAAAIIKKLPNTIPHDANLFINQFLQPAVDQKVTAYWRAL